MMSRSRFAAWVLALLMTAGLIAGCTGSGGDSAPPATDGGSDETAPAPADDGGSDSAPTASGSFLDEIEDNASIVYWEMQWGSTADYAEVVNEMVDEFNASNEYGIAVEMQMIPWDGYYETFLTAVTSGVAPDVATGPSANPIQYAQMGESLDLDPIMDAWRAENNPILDDIEDYMWEFYQYRGKQYGIPFGIDPKQILYRADFFEEAGITDLPTNYEEFIEVLKQLKDFYPDKIALLTGGGDQTGDQACFVWAGSNDAGFTTADVTADMTNAKNVEIYEFVKEMYDEGLFSPGTAGYMSADVEKIWLAGEACVVAGISGNIIEGTSVEANTRVLPNISGPSASGGGKYVNCVNGINGFSQTQYPNASRYFLKYWAENNKGLMVEGKQGNFPVRQSYYDDEYYSTSVWRMDTYQYCVTNGQTPVYPVANLYPQFAQLEGEQTFKTAFIQILSGADVQSALEEGNARIQACIDEYS